MLRPGDIAPDFELPDDRNRMLRLSSLLRDGPLILYFYPADFTPVCTREACMYRDVHEELAALGVRVLGVGMQAAETHARFRDRHGLPFPLLADRDRSVARAYGALGFLGLFLHRISYLIGKDGRILDAVRADLRLGRHEEFIRRVLATIRDGNPRP